MCSDEFAELYALTWEKQYKYAFYYLKDPYLAQDALQEVYILVFKNLENLLNPRLFLSWINQINYRVCYDIAKKNRRLQLELINLEEHPEMIGKASRDGCEQQVLRREDMEVLLESIRALPPKEEQAITMRYLYDMKLEEIAEVLQCSLSSVKRYIAGGKATLHEKMGVQLNG